MKACIAASPEESLTFTDSVIFVEEFGFISSSEDDLRESGVEQF